MERIRSPLLCIALAMGFVACGDSRIASIPAALVPVPVQEPQPPDAAVPQRLTLQPFGSGASGRGFSITPASACTVLTTNAEYLCAANVALTITADAPPAGVYFAGWHGVPECAHQGLDGAGTAAEPYRRDCTLTLGAARTLAAAFATTASPAPATEAEAASCDVTVPQHCFYPFPNNRFTRAAIAAVDVSSHTGLQVNLVTAGRFPNASTTGTPAVGATLNASEWNRNDGFPVNPKLVTFMDTDAGSASVGADEDDLDATSVPGIADLSRSLSPDSPVLMINATPTVDAAGKPCTGGEGCVANPEYLKPQLLWAEPELPKRELRDLDANGMMDTRVIPDAERALTLRVGQNLRYRHRYIVALRRFKRADGSAIEAAPNFRLYRDNQVLGTTFPTLTARRAAMEDIFAVLNSAGVARNELNQAWDFTVISQENLHERILHMRDTAIAALGDEGIPCYTVERYPNASQPDEEPAGIVSAPYTASTCVPGRLPTAVPGNTGVTNHPEGLIARTVDGTVAVPCFMTGNCAPGSKLHYTPGPVGGGNPQFGDNKPDQLPGAIQKANWRCRIPRAASGANPARISLYGHGLLGSQDEVRFADNVKRMGEEHNIIFCAMNWTGFATEDVATFISAFGTDISQLSAFIDRQVQGHINWLVLQELIVREGGFINHPAFRSTEGCPGGASSCPLYRLDFDSDGNGGMFYDGNSQGGIMGGVTVALSRRITRAALGVPGMNYSLLLRRSRAYQTQNGQVPSDVEATILCYQLETAYPNDLDLAFIYALTPMIWERTENAGFAAHMGDQPFADTPAHRFLLHVAHGDHLVTVWSNDILARSAGIPILRNGVDPAVRFGPAYSYSGAAYGAHKPYFGIPEITAFPHHGSALVVWDSGTELVEHPPLFNGPPRTLQDPHEHVRNTVAARQMKSQFLRSDVSGGGVFNSCAPGSTAGPCSSAVHD